MQTHRYLSILAIVAMLMIPALSAQSNKGGIAGTVFDSTGAVLPRARVVITNLGTNEAVRMTASESGAFSAPLLDPVEYRVTVEADGFRRAVVEKVKVDTSTTATVNVTLQPGALAVEVTVTGEAPQVNVESGTAGQTITERQIVEMPLANRSVLDLALTVANVTGVAGTEDPELGSDIPVPGFNLNVNGGRAGSTSILADGARNTGVGLARALVTFSPDTVQEFTVQTSNFSAEFGRTGGGVINMTTKSGTNRYQGLVSWVNRNPLFNAAPFTTARVNRPVSRRRQNQFAGILGGPVVVPKLYDGHDKTFFFFAYEPRTYSDSTPTDSLLPTAAMHKGDFSNLVTVTGGFTTRDVAERFGLQWQPAVIYNQFEQVGNQLRRRTLAAGELFPEFPGNRIPAGMLDPLSLSLLKYMPTPGDYFLNTDGGLRNYSSSSFIKNFEKRMNLKVDHQVSEKNRLSVRYTQVPIAGNRGRGDFQVGRDEINSGGTDYSWSRQILLTDSHLVSSRIMNELRLNYTYGRFTRNFPPMFDAINGRNFSTENGLPSLTPGGIPEFLTGGASIGWSQSQQNENAEHSYGIANNVSWVRGNQTWKFGADLLKQRLKTIPMFGASGRYEFNRNRNLTNSALTNGVGGNEFAQYLLGVYNLVTLRDTLIPYYYEWNSAAFFVQNDWKIRPNLTLNLGVRYSLQLPRTEKYDRQGAFRPDLAKEYALAQAVTLPSGRVVNSALVPPFAYSGRGGRSRYIVPVDWNAWEPRLGLAWVPRFDWNRKGKLVFRGGYGLSHATLTGGNRNPNPDFAAGTTAYTFDARQTNPNFVGRLCCNQPLFVPKTPEQLLQIPSDGLVYLNGINIAASAVSQNAHVPYVQSWSASLSYELPQNTVVELAYTGAKGTHLFSPPINLNRVTFQDAESYWARGLDALADVNDPLGRRDPSGNIIRYSQAFLGTRFLGFEGLSEVFDASANSIYHAGTASLRRRFSKGLSLTANYTFAKGIDEASDGGDVRFVNVNVRSPGHVNFGGTRAGDRAVSSFDVQHAFASTFVYDLPFGRRRTFLSGASGLVQNLIGGWSLSGLGRIQGGTPLSVVLRDDNRLGVQGNARAVRPDVVPGVPLLNPRWSRNCPVGQECEPYFNPAAFMRPVKGTLGNAPRTFGSARGPTQHTLDIAVKKEFVLGAEGRRRLEARFDFINILNHPIFRIGRLEDAGEIFAAPNEGLLTAAQYNAWADFNGRPRTGTADGDRLRALADQVVTSARIPGTTALRADFFTVRLPEGFHSMDANRFDITTTNGLALYRMRQAYTPDRWGYLAATAGRSGYNPRYIQFSLKLYF